MEALFPDVKKEDFEDDSDGTKIAELKYKVGNVSSINQIKKNFMNFSNLFSSYYLIHNLPL